MNVADREGDIHEWFLEAMRRGPGERAEFIIRAKCNRRLAKETEPRYLWEAIQKVRALGRITVELTRQPERPPRRRRRARPRLSAWPSVPWRCEHRRQARLRRPYAALRLSPLFPPRHGRKQ